MCAGSGLLKGSVWDGGKKPIEKPPQGGEDSSHTMQGVITRKQIHTVLVHADAFAFGMLGKGFVEDFWNAQFELPGILACFSRWLGNINAILNSCHQNRYREIVDNFPMRDNVLNNWRLGASFLRENQWLLDS